MSICKQNHHKMVEIFFRSSKISSPMRAKTSFVKRQWISVSPMSVQPSRIRLSTFLQPEPGFWFLKMNMMTLKCRQRQIDSHSAFPWRTNYRILVNRFNTETDSWQEKKTKKMTNGGHHWTKRCIQRSGTFKNGVNTFVDLILLKTFQNLSVSSPAPVTMASPSGDMACRYTQNKMASQNYLIKEREKHFCVKFFPHKYSKYFL